MLKNGRPVTVASEAQARILAEATRAKYFPPEAIFLGVVPDVDVRTLDEGHVIPNMGPPAIRGVWYPKLNI